MNIFQSKKKFKKGGVHFTADFFWKILFFLGFFLTIASFVFGFFIFREMNKEFVLSPEDLLNSESAISKERIDKTLEYFSMREKKSEEILNSPAPFTDPYR